MQRIAEARKLQAPERKTSIPRRLLKDYEPRQSVDGWDEFIRSHGTAMPSVGRPYRFQAGFKLHDCRSD